MTSLHRQSGYILVTVLILLAAMMTVGLATGQRAIGRRSRASYTVERFQVLHAAMSGSAIAKERIILDETPWDGPGDTWFKPISFHVNGIAVEVTIEDELSRLGINHIVPESGHLNRPLMNTLNQLSPESPNLEELWIKTIREWKVNHGYSPVPVDAVAQIPGFSTDIKQYLTATGNGRINLNTASSRLLTALGGSRLEQAVIRHREQHPLKSVFSLENHGNLYKGILPVVDVKTAWFRVTVVARGKFVTGHINALIYRSSDGIVPVQHSLWWS